VTGRTHDVPLARLEREVLTRYAQGWTRQRIAKEHDMSLRQVGYTLQRIRDRFGTVTTCAACVHAARNGWI
jgi:DNA-binding CsgD family transcriptional regulator